MRSKWGFSNEVQKHLGNVKVSRSLICMVRKGQRKNDAVLMAIIEVDHKLNKSDYLNSTI